MTLHSLRLVGDPPADAVFAELAECIPAVTPVEAMRFVIGLLHRPGTVTSPAPNGLPEGSSNEQRAIDLARRFIANGATLPLWADQQLLATGQRFFNDHALDVTSVLFYGALPTCYACADGALVVRLSETLVSHTHRRTSETAQFLFDIMNTRANTRERADDDLADEFSSSGGGVFAPGTRGYTSLMGVRLMHAAVRNFVSNSSAASQYDADERGVPVNQEDLLGTMFAFSVVTLRCLRRIGIPVSQAQAEAYYHLWAVAGCLLGIEEEHLPKSLADGEAVYDEMERRLVRSSVQCQELIRALVTEMDRSARASLPRGVGWLVRGTHSALVRHLCSPLVVGALNLPRSPIMDLVIRAATLFVRFGYVLRRRFGIVRRIARAASLQVVYAYVDRERGFERPPFDFGGLPAPRRRLLKRG